MCLLTCSGGVRRTTYPLRGEEILAAVPSIGRAVRVEGAPAPEADLTRALYEQYANQIFRYCVHQLGSREEAEDAVQSTFLNAFRGIKRGVVPELESAWLFKIAHNVCLSRRRTTWRRGRIESPTDFEVVEEMTPAPSRRADELIGLQDVLEQMPENQRRAILLREWQGLSYREIAEELEISQAAVETLIFRARRSLAAGLEQPPETKKRKRVRGADLGNILAGIKSLLLGGGAAAKVAATVAVVSASTVVAAAPVQQHRAKAHHPSAPPAASVRAARPASSPAASVAGPASSFPTAGAKHSARALPHGPRGHLGALGLSGGATASQLAEGTPAAPAPEPAPVAAGAAPTEPATTPEPPAQPAPAPAADPPRSSPAPTPAPPAGDKSKTDGSSTPSSKNGDSQSSGDGKSGDAMKGSSSTTAVIPPVTATTPVTKASDSKGTDDSKGSDSKGGDSKKSRAAAVTLAALISAATRQPFSVTTVTTTTTVTTPVPATTPAPVVAPPATVTLSSPAAPLTSATQASEGKDHAKEKDSGSGK
jgi:RNA polymerase sigma factor (sigma-70 family)